MPQSLTYFITYDSLPLVDRAVVGRVEWFFDNHTKKKGWCEEWETRPVVALYCTYKIDGSFVLCHQCSAPYHETCWERNDPDSCTSCGRAKSLQNGAFVASGANALARKSSLLQPPVPEILEPPMDPNELRQYIKIARSVGFQPVGLTYIQLLDFFKREGIGVYKYKQIAEWFARKIKAFASHSSPEDYYLRDCDQSVGLARGDCNFSVYRSIVPRRTLEIVEKILRLGDDKMMFGIFLCRYEKNYGDVFVYVRAIGSVYDGALVFDLWQL